MRLSFTIFAVGGLLLACGRETPLETPDDTKRGATHTVTNQRCVNGAAVGPMAAHTRHVPTGTPLMDQDRLHERVGVFADALRTKECISRGELTNITQESIANIFQTLEDPTHIVMVLRPYLRGGRPGRQIARRFFEYMLEKFPEERLQACANCWLGRIALRDVYDPQILNIRHEPFNEAVEYLEKVIQLPSREYYYFPALDSLAYLYRIKGDLNVDLRTDAHAKAREYLWTEFHAADEDWIKDQMIYELMAVIVSHEQAKEFFNKYRDRDWTSPKWKELFMERARICHSLE